MIATASNTVIDTLPVGGAGVAISPDGRTVYAVGYYTGMISVIDTASDTVSGTITTAYPGYPWGLAVSPDGSTIYVTSLAGVLSPPGYVQEIDTATSTVTRTIPVGISPEGVAVNPLGNTVYVTNTSSNTVSVIDLVSNTVAATIPVGTNPYGVAVTPDGSTAYVANQNSNYVSVINTANNKVITTIPVGAGQNAFGIFIQPGPRFAGTPGKADCVGVSVAALVRQYGGLNAAAASLHYPSVRALQQAIMAFCEA